MTGQDAALRLNSESWPTVYCFKILEITTIKIVCHQVNLNCGDPLGEFLGSECSKVVYQPSSDGSLGLCNLPRPHKLALRGCTMGNRIPKLWLNSVSYPASLEITSAAIKKI